MPPNLRRRANTRRRSRGWNRLRQPKHKNNRIARRSLNIMTFEEIRTAMKNRYDEPENDLVALYHFGFAHELPLIAICIVLVSAVVRRTANIDELSDFTGYSKAFIGAIAHNLENSGLWK